MGRMERDASDSRQSLMRTSKEITIGEGKLNPKDRSEGDERVKEEGGR